MRARESTVVRSAVRSVIEQIEKRCLLSATVSVIAPTASTAGLITVTGGKGSDALTLSVRNVGKESILFLADGKKESIVARQAINSKPFKNYNINLNGSDGNDTLINASNLHAKLDGGAGNDVVVGSVTGDTFLWNGLGNDKFVGTGATSSIEVSYPTTGSVSYDAANVVITDAKITSSVTQVIAQGKKSVAKTPTGSVTIYNIGTVIVNGTAGNDQMNAADFSKNVRLLGLAGNDALVGGKGSDVIDGGTGKDSLSGGSGRDTIVADYADFSAKAGPVVISGGSNIDTLWMDGQDLTTKPSATGATFLNTDFEVVNGGRGKDKIDSSQSKSGVEVYGNDGNDTIIGSDNDDWIDGGAGNDSLVGGEGHDTMAGGDDDDTVVADYADFTGGSANTSLTGGDGKDALWMDGQDPAAAPSGPGTADYVNVDFEAVLGGRGNDKIDSSSMTTAVAVNGQGGNDTIIGGSGDDSLNGGDGDDLISGNDGTDTLDGGLGDDTLLGGAGTDLLLDTGGKLVDDRTASDQVVVQSSGPLTDEMLGRKGSLMVLQQKGSLSLVGPSTGGFKLLGDWVSEIDSSGIEIFKATSPFVKIQTYFGDVPIPNVPAFPISVITKADTIAGSGVFTSFNLGGSAGIQLELNNPDSPLGQLAGQFGISGTVPDLSFGIDLGSNLSGLGFPLANGLPYFYANANLGGSISFGGATASFSAFNNAIAFDPADPAMFMNVASPFPPGVGILDNLKIGGSLHGYIPYTPANMPNIFKDTAGYKDGDVLGYGNLYLTGRVNMADILKSPPVPVLLTGSVVLGLNSSRNLPASLPKFSGTDIKSALGDAGGFTGSITQMLGATSADDIFIGASGKAQLGIKKAGFEFTMPLGDASFGLKSISGVGTVGAHGTFSTNPFADTPLKDFISPPIDLSVTADAGFSTAGAFTVGFGYSEDTSFAGIGTFHKSLAFTLNNNGFSAAVSGGVTISDTILGVTGTAYGTISGNLSLAIINSALEISGGGSITGGVSVDAHLPGIDPVFIDVPPLSFTFNNSGFSLDLPFFDPIDVTW